ncbi:MAG: hypothetical protein K2N22_02995 [Clostridia bacterium]|nr:hypothetical protein [Clostridia bacterium]
MAEERLIDDDKDRKYKIRKNADGEEELVIDEGEDEEVEIPVFEVPYEDGDDEDAATLTPEQYAERERIKKEEEAARAKKAEQLLAEANEKYAAGDMEGAQYAITRAEELSKSGEVYCLMLKTFTRGFKDFTALEQAEKAAEGVKEYASPEQKAELKKDCKGLKAKIAEVKTVTDDLSAQNEAKKAERRQFYATEKKRAQTFFISAAVPFAALLICAIVLACNMFAAENGAVLIATIAVGALAFIAFIFTLITARKFVSASRNVRLNEKDSSTKLGREYAKSKKLLDTLTEILNSFDQNDIS